MLFDDNFENINNNYHITIAPLQIQPSNEMSLLSATPSLQSILFNRKISSYTNSIKSLNSNSSYNYSYSSADLDDSSLITNDDYFSITSQENDSLYSLVETIDHPLASIPEPKNKQSQQSSDQSNKFSKKQSRTRILYSNLSKSLKSLASNATNVLSFNERITDTRIPNTRRHNNYNNINNVNEKIEEIQMQTFQTICQPAHDCKFPCLLPKNIKSREPRINSNFLRLYAQDYTSKSQNLLAITEYEIDLYQQDLIESELNDLDTFLNQFDYSNSPPNFKTDLKIGLLSREKLWFNVILPPRNDTPLSQQQSHINYVYNPSSSKTNNNPLVVRNNGKYKPWLQFQDQNQQAFKPYGNMANDVQFTVKGWCNERWVAKS
ncbi:hypothetical protein CANARDRAFT_26438 [[Candida] arabinofermentans NRRL YB-2248]|uniref:Uncharacterized protein n=1 Tax=[Candida] arabinofermentans NRRL YB-2248 TaxID=983967 RepID=A0A1E4T946_9ASCO|nr:hypothetical protein CANARDRAFT_26438 [[Candida] arabinofermentans NRRL YB-2248]